MSELKLAELKTRLMKRQTLNEMQWAINTFKEWRNYKLTEQGFDCKLVELDLDVVTSISKENLCYGLCKFIPEIRKKDGSDYPGKMLYEIVVSIQKYLNQKNIPWKLLDDPHFLHMKIVLDNVMKERAAARIGMVKRQAEFITEEFENQLWSSGTLGEDTPEKLHDTVLFLLGINLALRVGDEHYDLQ